jgi:hypothetical protein
MPVSNSDAMPLSNSDAMPLSFCIPYTAQPGSCPYWVLAR